MAAPRKTPHMPAMSSPPTFAITSMGSGVKGESALLSSTLSCAFSLSQELVAENLPHEMLWWDARTDFAMEAKIDGEESYFHALYEAMGTRIPDDRLHLITTLAEEKHAATLVYFTRAFTGPEREILLENMEDITLVIEEVEEKKG